jgi:hypothetical protein
MKKVSVLVILLLSLQYSFSQEKKESQSEIEGWYFRAVSGYPASVSFEPVVLFKDGSYFEVSDKPITDMDLSKSKDKDKHLWGKWKRAATIFTLTNNKGNAYEYDLDSGNWFPAFPFNPKINLKGVYEKISGGNFGNGLYALFNSELIFLDASHFTHSQSSGVSSFGSNAWKNSEDSGNYSIKNHTIEFNYNDGRKVRMSFAFGAEGENRLDTDLLFIGGKAYVIE